LETSHQAARAAVVVLIKETPNMARDAASATPCQRSTPAGSESPPAGNEVFGVAVFGLAGAGALMRRYYGGVSGHESYGRGIRRY
jgi:hypothetical protein